MTSRAAVVLSACLLAAPSAAQPQPQWERARVETRAVTGGLEKAFRAIAAEHAEAAWIGYALAAAPGAGQSCCGSRGEWGCCRLEKETGLSIRQDEDSKERLTTGRVKLEGPEFFWVLLRVENRHVGRIAACSEGCELDAGGLRVVWLTGVTPEESVALLSVYATSGATEEDDHRSGKGLRNHAVMAIALHGDAAADRALENFVAASRPETLRREAAFWMGVARGARGFETLRRMVKEDPSEDVREHVIFALSQSKRPGAIATMIDAARNDRSSRVRGQALFWLAQRAGARAAGVITDAIENDPETEVKKKAVFALSQLPKDEGVPRLIQVARSNRNPAVRKQAVFWLGQSNDPRALAFFEEVLK